MAVSLYTTQDPRERMMTEEAKRGASWFDLAKSKMLQIKAENVAFLMSDGKALET